ncbi:MAG: hypothetical protein HKN27_06690 [Silicimonas sp.]|nr:hypothetical protein [Silicimonas sp.]
MNMSVRSRVQRALVFTVLPIAAIAMSTEVSAEQTKIQRYAQEIGASERVNYSGKLRMLSQKIVASSCNFAAGIDAEISSKAMQATKAEFELVADALEHGNPDLGIFGEEKRKKTRASITRLRDQWAPVVADLNGITNDPKAANQAVASLAVNSELLLDNAKLLVSDLLAQYSDPSIMTQADAIRIDISGRQRMLTQRMSKNVCLLASGVGGDTATAELAATAEMFETSLLALRGGFMEAGINPPPNENIAKHLQIVAEDWEALKPAVQAVLSGTDLSPTDRAVVFHGMNEMTADMNTVVGLYVEASKHGTM